MQVALVTDGWNTDETNWVQDMYSGTSPKTFVPFGIFAEAGSSDLRPVQSVLLVEAEPVVSRVMTSDWMLVYADSTTKRFFPFTGALPVSEDIGEARASIEIESESGDNVTCGVAWAEANFPKDPSDWSVSGTEILADASTTTYGTTFTTISPTKRYVRFGVNAALASSGLGMARVRVRLEYRD